MLPRTQREHAEVREHLNIKINYKKKSLHFVSAVGLGKLAKCLQSLFLVYFFSSSQLKN